MKKTFEEWEKEKGLFAKSSDKYDLGSTLSEDDFLKIFFDNMPDFHGVDYQERIKFLRDNKYDITRENMIDPFLSHRD